MKNTKKIMAGALALAVAAPMLSANVFAADQSTTTNVSYDNTNTIPDPDNPTNPDWAVQVPSSIAFNDTNKKIDTSVKLVKQNGGDFSDLTTKKVIVKVKSANGYDLHLGTAGADDMEYSLHTNRTVSGTTMDNISVNGDTTDKNVAEFTPDGSEDDITVKGEAVLKGTAKKTGSHTDVLTYTVSSPVVR